LVVAAAVVAVAVVVGLAWFMADGRKEAGAPQASAPGTTGPSVGVAPDEKALAAAKQEVDRKIIAGGSGAAADQKAVLAKEYVKAAVPLLQAGKWDEASEQLFKAKAENPDEPLIYVNQAIVHLKQEKRQEALAQLELAFQKGFRDFAAIEADPDLKPLTSTPAYRTMVAAFKGK
jgi:hypothetical protein